MSGFARKITALLLIFCFGVFSPAAFALAAASPTAENVDNVLPDLIYPDKVKVITQKWQWDYAGESYSWRVQIPDELVRDSRDVYKAVSSLYFNKNAARQKEVLAKYKNTRTNKLMLSLSYTKPRLSLWSNDANHDRYIGLLAQALQSYAQGKGYNSYQTADFVLSWVASVPFVLTNYNQLPAHTLVDGGDCKGKSILCAAILNKLGYSTKFFLYKASAAYPEGHLAVGVAFKTSELPTNTDQKPFYYTSSPKRYYFAETTSPGMHIGEVRSAEKKRTPMILPTT